MSLLVLIFQVITSNSQKVFNFSTGKYAIILSFDSLADRNRIYPPEGGISDDFEEILTGTEDLWDKLGSYVEGDAFGNHTDYVTILP